MEQNYWKRIIIQNLGTMELPDRVIHMYRLGNNYLNLVHKDIRGNDMARIVKEIEANEKLTKDKLKVVKLDLGNSNNI